MKTYKKQKIKSKSKTKTRKRFFFNPKNSKKSFDVYIDKNPRNTIPIQYTTVNDVKATIHRLETLYKNKKFTHKRIWQVGMIMKVRLRVLKQKKQEEYKLAKRYFDFLSSRTKLDDSLRYKSVFIV